MVTDTSTVWQNFLLMCPLRSAEVSLVRKALKPHPSSVASIFQHQLAARLCGKQSGPAKAYEAIADESGVRVQGGLAFNPTNVTALSLSSTFFNYAPCLIQEAAAGAAFTAAGINFVPQVHSAYKDFFPSHLETPVLYFNNSDEKTVQRRQCSHTVAAFMRQLLTPHPPTHCV